jgi:NADPH-dependent glutamate synthase beta subunit-like oxidoreductase
MPYINFMWTPKADASRIVDALRAVADAHKVSFYVNAKEEEEEHPVVLNGVDVPTDILGELKRLAAKADVTMHVHPG